MNDVTQQNFFCRTHFGATGTPVLDFWWRLLWVSKPEWVLPYSHCGGECNVHFLRSTFWCYTLPSSWWTALWGVDQVHILPKDITVWQQWVSNPQSTDHGCCALTIRPRVPAYPTKLDWPLLEVFLPITIGAFIGDWEFSHLHASHLSLYMARQCNKRSRTFWNDRIG